jgi:DNA repair protein RadD
MERRYLVNVAVLTTGFDAPHVDFIAILRATESVTLYQQIVGRGLRLFPEKTNCLVIDYAKNGFDLFAPEVGEKRPSPSSQVVQVPCPGCEHCNDFWGELDESGRVVSHYGRRCQGLDEAGERCHYRFVFKECPRCNGECDIAARRCEHCGQVLVDPDEMLRAALREKDTLVLRVSGMELEAEGSRLVLTYHDEDGERVKERFDFSHEGQRGVFNRIFSRRLADGRRPLALESAEQAVTLQALMPRPDFVICKRKKLRGQGRGPRSYFCVEQRIFHYGGVFRRAADASVRVGDTFHSGKRPARRPRKG